MRLKLYLPALALLLCAGLAVLAWRQYRELAVLRAQVGSDDDRRQLEAQITALRRRTAELEARLAVARKEGSAAAAEAQASRAANLESAAVLLANLANNDTTGDGANRQEAEFETLAALADLPEFQQLMAVQQRGTIASKYAALFQKLHLTPEQQRQFERLLADRQSAYADAMVAARDQGLTGKEARAVAQAVARNTQKEIDGSLKSLLGPQGYSQYQNYERTMPQRETVNQLASRLGNTPTPLNARQQEQLIQALANGARQDATAAAALSVASGRKPTPQPATLTALPNSLGGMGLASNRGAVITPSGSAKAQTILSPAQMAVLQQMQAEQQAQQRLGNLLRTKPPTAPAPSPAKPGKG